MYVNITMLRGFFGNLIFAIIARMLCGNHLQYIIFHKPAFYRLINSSSENTTVSTWESVLPQNKRRCYGSHLDHKHDF